MHKPSHPTPPFVVNVLPARPIVAVVPQPPVKREPDYPAAITAWATVALVIATGVLAYLTWVLARATSRASVIVTIEPNPAAMNFVDIHIVNEGNAAAYDVRIEFDPPLPSEGGQFNVINYPSNIRILGAGQRLVSSLCEAFLIMDNAYVLNVVWRTKPKGWRRQSLSYAFDLSHLKGMSRLGDDPAIQSASEIKKVRELLEKMGSGRSRLRVDAYSQADRDNERQANLAAYAMHSAPDAEASNLPSSSNRAGASRLRNILRHFKWPFTRA